MNLEFVVHFSHEFFRLEKLKMTNHYSKCVSVVLIIFWSWIYLAYLIAYKMAIGFNLCSTVGTASQFHNDCSKSKDFLKNILSLQYIILCVSLIHSLEFAYLSIAWLITVVTDEFLQFHLLLMWQMFWLLVKWHSQIITLFQWINSFLQLH